ncbi:ATP-binding cassette domain-containing protein [Actinoplanes palleronii]|uniref:ABC transporter ATP-binding protein n=1 Tax=Actinoplanes palleronii TaxID=113570 RepID=A0ABQ4B842_9ACTN|nr:ATP-binding cassette domain-containing protein [Actinoplanes palleronii]GIE66812.1 ABC transporter ATP-binding protein [Actinoplanes palleronii]
MLFDGVWFRYARRAPWALREAAATVEPGQTVVVLGANGAGKSTLLQLAAGVLRPVRGTVRNRPAVVGWVPERFPADQPFTAIGYLRAMAGLRHAPATAAAHWVDRLGLTPHADTPLNALSKGTAQKVGLAQALLVRPGLLVLDEPWEGLDAQARTLVPEIVAEVTAAGGAVLVSDHRGEITGLPDTTHWTVAAGALHLGSAPPPVAAPPPDRRPAGPDEVVVEIAVPRTEADATVVQLIASGHRILRVREPDGVRPERLTAHQEEAR